MYETLVVATDGSAGVERAVRVAVDFADRFDATVHAVSVIDDREIESAPESVREEVRTAHDRRAQEAVEAVETHAADAAVSVTTAVRNGHPATAITDYARSVGADAVAVGTSGRHGENRFLVGSVAERVVRRCPVPVLSVRRTEGDTTADAS